MFLGKNQARGRIAILLVWLSTFIAPGYGNCGVPPRLDFAILEDKFIGQNDFPVDSNVTYACLPGYIRNIPFKNIILCLSNSTWSTAETFCQRRSCPYPGDIDNGDLQFDSLLFGSRANYTCHTGYHMLSKKNYRECQADGTWSNVAPVCEAQICTAPNPIENGSYDPIKDEYTYQEAVIYRCNSRKYTLIGQSSLVCNANGNWSSDSPVCVDVECPNPYVENAMKVTGFVPPYYYKSAVTFECSQGFTMKGSGLVTCNLTKQWDPPLPTCSNTTICTPPNLITNGSYDPVKNEYAYKEAVRYQCNSEKYALKGESSLVCNAYGKWSSDPPVCDDVECPSPYVENAKKVTGLIGPHYYKSVVTFECSPGFTIKGSSLVTCNLNKQWDPPLPTCSNKGSVAAAMGHGIVILKMMLLGHVINPYF